MITYSWTVPVSNDHTIVVGTSKRHFSVEEWERFEAWVALVRAAMIEATNTEEPTSAKE